MPVVSEQQAIFLRDRQVGILGTGRRDGSPQLSMITYLYDGEHILISVTKDRAKYANVARNPRVSLLVPDGRQQVIVYGTAEILEGRERDRAIIAIREHQGDPLPDGYDLDRFSERLDELGRVVLRITPAKVLGEGTPSNPA
jgi:PPOX class probable F420-dependent enzyme